MFSTAYLNIILMTITAPQLVRIVLQFLITGSHDDEPLLDALVGRIECVSEVSESVAAMVNICIEFVIRYPNVSLSVMFSIIGINVLLGES